MKVLFWNARSVIQRKEEIQQMLQDTDIFVIVESWLSPSITHIQFPGFNNFRKDRMYSKGGGILILIKKT